MYELGLGVAVDFTKAFYWYQKVAVQGYARAQTNLGALYETGQGVEQSYKRPLLAIQRQPSSIMPGASFTWAACFRRGLGLKRILSRS